MAIDPGRTRTSTAVDRLFNAAFALYVANGTVRAGNDGGTDFETLPMNVWEAPDGYGVDLLAPGLDEQSVNVTVHDDTLFIEGELRSQAPVGASVIRMEFDPARFHRSLRLGAAVDSAKVEALYHDGWLTVRMSKVERARPRQIHGRLSQGDTSIPLGQKGVAV